MHKLGTVAGRSRRRTAALAAAATAALAVMALPGVALPAVATAHSTSSTQQMRKNAASKTKKAKRKKTQRVAINFAAVAGTKPVSCGTPIEGLGTTSRTAQLTDLRFYVSGVQLLRKGGGRSAVKLPPDSQWWVTRGRNAVTLIDLENGTGACAKEGTKGMNAYVRGTVPKGKYVGVRFRIGVPYALNHSDTTTAPAPLNLTAMAWSWQAGRKFAKIEVSDPGDSMPWQTKAFFVHIGSTGCAGDPAAGETATCTLPNVSQVSLSKFNPAKRRIAVDLKALFAGVDVTTNGGGAAGCMSATTDPECPAIFSALGMKLGTTEKTRQTVFRAIKK